MSDQTANAYPCPCCRNLTLSERADFLICPVCFWEDDGQDDTDADEVSGPNPGLTLTQARKNYASFGACSKEFISRVRSPKVHERPGQIQ